MPRGQKSKVHAREKCHQARSDIRHLQDAQATAAGEEESPSSPSPPFGGNSQSYTTGSVGKSRGSQNAPPATTTSAGVLGTRSEEGARSQDEKDASMSKAPPSTDYSCRTFLDEKAMQLIQLMLRKYNMREPITKEDMMKHVIKRYKKHFHQILRKASELLVLAFGIEVKEVDPTRHCYALVSKLQHPGDGMLRGENIMPSMGLLMTILCVIFMKGNCATEGDIWEVLHVMGIYAGEKHFIHGEPKTLITQDLVQERYQEYRQVPDSDPARYKFLWGPRACAETSKMRVLAFLAKMHNTVPSAFPALYEEALQDEEERTRARIAAMVRTGALARVLSSISLSSFSHQE